MPETPSPTVKFPHRSRRGVLAGLSTAQLALAALSGLLLLLVVLLGGVLTALALLPLWAVLLALTLGRRRGRPLPDWTPIVLRYALRRIRHQLLWLRRPGPRPVRDGLLHLPGRAASLRVVTSGDGRLSAVHNPHGATLTAVLRVSSRAFALLDPATQQANVAGWGRALAALARTGHVARVQVLERTVPGSGDALRRYWAEHGAPHAPGAGALYEELIASAGPAAAPHEMYVTLALDLKATRRLAAQAGGGLSGAFGVLAQLTSTAEQALRDAGLTSSGWLTAGQIAAVTRSAYDPAALPALDSWSEGPLPSATPAAAGPVVLVEHRDRISTDSAVHATYWVENWPRTAVSAAFLHPVQFSAGVRRSLSLIYTPQGLDSALRDVRRRKSAIIADAAERARRGQVESEADSTEYANVRDRERQLIAGHADVALTGLITVSAENDKDLRAACATIETAAVAAQLDLRPLLMQQAEAFTSAALPLALAA
ncbi:SCO6880 family protein [Streptomyces sp. NPDC060243]|uniref:SCO6880 family protein n=1 Tax=Streptomyces sp. NPDC060243 TaxID=3347081 RepID=UPI0036461323